MVLAEGEVSSVHLGGYADAGYVTPTTGSGSFYVGHFAPIFHYKYDQLILLESELELEYEDEQTTINMEYLALDLFLNDYVTVILGRFLSPIGQFQQNLHPSWINKLPNAPVGFGHDSSIIPLHHTGLHLRSVVPWESLRFNYSLFVVNGPELENTDNKVSVRPDSSEDDRNKNKAVGTRLGFIPTSGLELGISALTAKTALKGEEDRDYQIIGADLLFQGKNMVKGLELRGEFTQSTLASGGTVDPGKKKSTAWYTQLSYLIGTLKIEPVLRYAQSKTVISSAEEQGHGLFNGRDDHSKASESGETKKTQFNVGVNYLFANNVIGKLAFDVSTVKDETTGETDTNKNINFQLAFGF
jgi:hypothetical protein